MPDTTTPIQISIQQPKQSFQQFLDDKENRRIIFSGPFGSGKTYFLKAFFQNTDVFHCIRLAPVNYSVAQNEDIFELIQFDILFQLLSENVFPKEAGFSKTDILRHINLLDPVKGIQGLLEKTEKTGHNIFQAISRFEELLQNERTTSTASDDIENLKKLDAFLKKHTKENGKLYEQNVITQLLYILVSKLGNPQKETELIDKAIALPKQKETVLLIDDIDRIDPEHIFRILNIFAAHFDIEENGENKFGFDRVVLVCDVQNIRNIFRSRYGQDTDFSGYIDKFYSRRVFVFDNRQAVEESVSSLLHSLNIKANGNFTFVTHKTWPQHIFLVYILRCMIRIDALNIRSLLRIQGRSFTFQPIIVNSYNCSSSGFLQLLNIIMGDAITLREALQKCIATKIGQENFEKEEINHNLKFGYILPLLKPSSNKTTDNADFKVYQVPESNITIVYKYIHAGERHDDLFAKVESITEGSTPDIFPALLEAFDNLRRLNLL